MSEFAKNRFPALAPQPSTGTRGKQLPLPNLPWGELAIAAALALLWALA